MAKTSPFVDNALGLLLPCRSPARPCSPFPRQDQLSGGSWNKKRHIVAKVEWHPGEPDVRRLGHIHRRSDVRARPRPALPQGRRRIRGPFRRGRRAALHLPARRPGGRPVVQLAEVAVPRDLFRKILSLIDDLRRRPAPARPRESTARRPGEVCLDGPSGLPSAGTLGAIGLGCLGRPGECGKCAPGPRSRRGRDAVSAGYPHAPETLRHRRRAQDQPQPGGRVLGRADNGIKPAMAKTSPFVDNALGLLRPWGPCGRAGSIPGHRPRPRRQGRRAALHLPARRPGGRPVVPRGPPRDARLPRGLGALGGARPRGGPARPGQEAAEAATRYSAGYPHAPETLRHRRRAQDQPQPGGRVLGRASGAGGP